MQNTQVLQTETLQTQGYYPTLDTEKSTFYEAKPDDKCASGSLKRLVSILYVQLVATFIVIISSLSIQDFTSFLSDNPHIIQLCSLTFMFSILLLRYSRKISKHIPVNYTLWCLYTLSFGLILASFISINPLNTFVFLGQVTFTIAFLWNIVMVASLFYFDLTHLYGKFLEIKIFGILLAAFAVTIMTSTVQILICFIFLGLYLFGLIIDFQSISGLGKFKVAKEDLVLSVTYLYLDTMGFFTYFMVAIFLM